MLWVIPTIGNVYWGVKWHRLWMEMFRSPPSTMKKRWSASGKKARYANVFLAWVYGIICMTLFFDDRANACQNFDNYWWKIQNFIKKSSNNTFFGFCANSGFGFCDMILGFGANSGFWSFDTIFWILGSGFRFFDTILGFGVLVFSHHIRVWGFCFFAPN